MRFVHYYNNKRSNSQKDPDKMATGELYLLGSVKCKGSMPDHHTEKNIAKRNGFFQR